MTVPRLCRKLAQMPSLIPVFYDERQNAVVTNSASPSSSKPAQAVASWLAAGMQIEILPFDPVAREAFYTVHDRSYVDGIFDLRIRNGFHKLSAELNQSLPWTTGSMLAASRHAVLNGGVACSPTSGFHHAGWSMGGGYCTFNGLMVAAWSLLAEKQVERVGILDLDMHYGDGTESIMLRCRLLGQVEHYTFGLSAVEHGGVNHPDGAELWLEQLPAIVRNFKATGCGVLLYQAGADPHENDPLGGVMTSDQMRRRDQIVFDICAEIGLPVAWNLAGGYQSPLRNVLDLHDATMAACVNAFCGWNTK